MIDNHSIKKPIFTLLAAFVFLTSQDSQARIIGNLGGASGTEEVEARWTEFINDLVGVCTSYEGDTLTCCLEKQNEWSLLAEPLINAGDEAPPFEFDPNSELCLEETSVETCSETEEACDLDPVDVVASKPTPSKNLDEQTIHVIIQENQRLRIILDSTSSTGSQDLAEALKDRNLSIRLTQTYGMDRTTPPDKPFKMLKSESFIEEVSNQSKDGDYIKFQETENGIEQITIVLDGPVYSEETLGQLKLSEAELGELNLDCAQADQSNEQAKIMTCLEKLALSTEEQGLLISQFEVQILTQDGSYQKNVQIIIGSPIDQSAGGGSGCSLTRSSPTPDDIAGQFFVFLAGLGLMTLMSLKLRLRRQLPQ